MGRYVEHEMTKSWSRGLTWRFAICGKWLYINNTIGRQRKMAPLTSAIGSFMSFLYDICGWWYDGRGGRQQQRDFPCSFRIRVWFCVPFELTWERRMSPPKDAITQTETWSCNCLKTFGCWSRLGLSPGPPAQNFSALPTELKKS